MKASTVLITISAIAAAVAGAVLLRRHFHEKQQAQAHFMQVAAPVQQLPAKPAPLSNPVKAVAQAPLIAQKPKHPAKMIQEAKWGKWGSITGTNELSVWI